MRARLTATLLGVLGLGRMAAALAGLDGVAAAAAATGAAPAPRVFSSVRGLETFSSRFSIEWETSDDGTRSVAVTPERIGRLRGPYNRRNVYGAAIAYGPLLASDPRTAPLLASVQRHALCGDAPLLRELGLDASGRTGPLRVRVEPKHRPAGASWPSVLEEHCE